MISTFLRLQMLSKFNEITENNEEKSKCIEQSVFDFFQSFCQQHDKMKASICKKLYLAKIQQIYLLLKKNSYVNIDGSKLIDQDLNQLKQIAFVHYKELCPAKWDLLEPDLKVLDKKITSIDENVYTTDAFTCGICKENKCIYSEVQIRSCDENATIFVRCMNCGHCFHG